MEHTLSFYFYKRRAKKLDYLWIHGQTSLLIGNGIWTKTKQHSTETTTSLGQHSQITLSQLETLDLAPVSSNKQTSKKTIFGIITGIQK